MTSTTMSGVRGYQRLMLANSFTKAIADRLLLVLMAGLGVGAMNVMMGPMFVALEDAIAEMLEAIPESIMAFAAGADMATPAGWYTGEMYGIVAPFAVVFVAISSASKAFGGEVENRTLGLIAANPIRRTRLAVDKTVAMIIHVVATATLIGLGMWIGATVADLGIGITNMVAITLMLSLLAIAAGGLAMVISIITGRSMFAILVVALLAVIAYAWSSFVPLAGSVEALAWLSPWHHYIGTDPLGSGVDLGSAILLAGIGAALMVTGVALFRRRDIPG